MSLKPHRDRFLAGEDERQAVLARLAAEQPDDALERVAYWTRIGDFAREQLDDAVLAAKREGATWGAVGIFHDRSQQATNRKFGQMVRDALG